MNGRSLLKEVDGPSMPKLSRRDAEGIVVGGGFVRDDVSAIEEYSKWTKDALVVEAMALSHKILELQKIQSALIEQNRAQRETVQASDLRGKKALWKAHLFHSRLRFMLMGKHEGNSVSSTTSPGETEEGRQAEGKGVEGSLRVHGECSTCTCSPAHEKEGDVTDVVSKFPQQTLVLQLEYAVGLHVEDFQRKFKVIISDKRKEYVKTSPVGVIQTSWLRAAQVTLRTVGDAEEVVLHTGATAFLTCDDKLNWNPYQRFDNLLRCAKFILGGSRHLDMLRVTSIAEFLSLERLYFPLHDDVDVKARSGDEVNVVAVIWKSLVWSDLVRSLLRIAMPLGNEEYLLKVLKNLRRLSVPSNQQVNLQLQVSPPVSS